MHYFKFITFKFSFNDFNGTCLQKFLFIFFYSSYFIEHLKFNIFLQNLLSNIYQLTLYFKNFLFNILYSTFVFNSFHKLFFNVLSFKIFHPMCFFQDSFIGLFFEEFSFNMYFRRSSFTLFHSTFFIEYALLILLQSLSFNSIFSMNVSFLCLFFPHSYCELFLRSKYSFEYFL